MSDTSPLEAEICRLIAAAGPMPVDEYMALCLSDREHGYYTTHDPFGARGDFITAPEVSQMFGEMIGLWMAAVWKQMGSPENLRIVELGPGRGTMLKDALRAAKVLPNFREAAVIHLVEISPALEAQQQRTLEDLPMPMYWHPFACRRAAGPRHHCRQRILRRAADPSSGEVRARLARAPDRNRFHRQARVYGRARTDPALRHPAAAATARVRPTASIFEWRADNVALELGKRLMRDGGAALVIDYGHTQSAVGDTLQAVGRHAYADPLSAPGTIDLTAHVDFQALASAVEAMGANGYGPITQSQFCAVSAS